MYDDLKSRTSYKSEVMMRDDKKVKYYTRLPSFSMLKAIYDFISTDAPTCMVDAKLDVFEQLMLVLMKLRLNLGDQDLAYRFGISQSTVSQYFAKMIELLYVRLSCLVYWSERNELMKTMPMEFRKHFKKCVVIIDCFEVFIERPTSLAARARTWSNYKHHNTIKFLIGITPQGSIAYISNGWGGRASDVYITEHSGLLGKLLPGDVILADRGFTIQESAGLYCVEVKLPPFEKNN